MRSLMVVTLALFLSFNAGLVFADGTLCPTEGNWHEGKVYGVDYFQRVTVVLRVTR